MLREEAQPYVQGGDQKKSAKVLDTSKDVKLLDKDQEIQIGVADDDEEADNEDNGTISNTNNYDFQQGSQSPNIHKPSNNKENLHPKQMNASKLSNNQVSQSPILPTGGVTPVLKKASSSNATSQQLVPLDQLFTHSSDNAVKPIIGNREIEKAAQENIVVKDQLPFQYISAEEVNKNIDSELMEQHFENIYNALQSSQVSANDKLNIMNYFEQIIQSSAVANRLLNSAFTPLLLKLLKTAKIPAFKLRICCVIGLLIRHATVIEAEVSQINIIEHMVEIIQSKETVTVRRKACAALGEYLFYGATQMDEDPNNPYWDISPLSFQTLVKILRAQGEDETVKFYAVKTIENISSQSIATGSKFASPEIISILVNCFNLAKNENLKVSCAVGLANLILLDNSQVDLALQQITLKSMVSYFTDGHQRVQQAMITIFNLYLLQSLNQNDQSNLTQSPQLTTPKGNSNSTLQLQQLAIHTVNKLLMEESNLLLSLIHLLDHGSTVTKGKAALSLMLIIKFNVNTLINLSDESLHFYTVLDKSLREQNDYLKSCISHLISQLNEGTAWMIGAISEEISQLNDTNQESEDSYKDSKRNQRKQSHNQPERLKGNLAFLNVLSQYSQAQALQPAIFNQQYLPVLASLLQASTPVNSNQMLSQVQHHLFNIMSRLATNSKILMKQQDTIISGVLKICIESMTTNPVIESRFLFLKLVIELTSALLSEEAIYDYPGFLKQSAADINKLIINVLLPQMRTLLSEQPPLPSYALKFVAILLEHNPQFLAPMKKNKIIQGVLDTFKLEGNNITSHTLTIIQKIVDGSPLEDIFAFGIIEKSSILFNQFVQSQQDWAYDDIASVMGGITTRLITELSRSKMSHVINPESTAQPTPFPQELLGNVITSRKNFQNVEQLYQCIPSALQLVPQCSPQGQSSLVLFLLHCTYIFCGKLSGQRNLIFSIILPVAKQALAQLLQNTPNVTVTNANVHNYTLFKRCIKLFHWVVSLNEQKPFKCDKKDILQFIIDKLKTGCDDRTLLQAMKDVPRYVV